MLVLIIALVSLPCSQTLVGYSITPAQLELQGDVGGHDCSLLPGLLSSAGFCFCCPVISKPANPSSQGYHLLLILSAPLADATRVPLPLELANTLSMSGDKRKCMANTYYFLQKHAPRARALSFYPYSPNFRQDAF
jgi:hypothetical protein